MLDAAAWKTFYTRVQATESVLPRVRMLALLVGEDGELVEGRAGAALVAGDIASYNAELLRLTDKLLERIHDF